MFFFKFRHLFRPFFGFLDLDFVLIDLCILLINDIFKLENLIKYSKGFDYREKDEKQAKGNNN